MDKDLLNQYLQNSCTEDELNPIIEWFKHSAGTFEDRDILFRLLDEIPEDSGVKEDDRMDRILETIHQRIDLKKSETLIEQTEKEAVWANRRKQVIGIFSKVAAAIFIPVFLFGLYTSARYLSDSDEMNAASMAYYEVYSSADAITKVDLSDGTVVWLNYKSRLRYPARFEGDCRGVELTGEGYFKVSHNPDIPFVVSTGMIDIIARGTEFNVYAYPDDNKIETTLVEGKIEIEETINRTTGQKLISLLPSERLIYNRIDNGMNFHRVEDDRYYAWKEGKLIFKNETMDEVVKKLSRWFNIDIEIKDAELNDLTYTATFIDETLPQVMELLAIATPINYSINNRGKLDDETFSKRKVILSAKTTGNIRQK